MCEATPAHELNSFHTRFDLSDKECAGKYDLPQEERPLSLQRQCQSNSAECEYE